jgi:hypothetical protein
VESNAVGGLLKMNRDFKEKRGLRKWLLKVRARMVIEF